MVRFKNRYILGKIEWFEKDDIQLNKLGSQGITSSDIFRAVRGLVINTLGNFGFATIQSSIQGKINLCIKTFIESQIITSSSKILE